MKIAVIGNRNVGMAAFGELLPTPEIRELPMTEEEKKAFDASADVAAAVTKNFIGKGSNLNDEIE